MKRLGLQSLCSHAAWRRPDCRRWVAKKGHLPVWGACMLQGASGEGVEGEAQLPWGVGGCGSALGLLM